MEGIKIQCLPKKKVPRFSNLDHLRYENTTLQLKNIFYASNFAEIMKDLLKNWWFQNAQEIQTKVNKIKANVQGHPTPLTPCRAKLGKATEILIRNHKL